MDTHSPLLLTPQLHWWILVEPTWMGTTHKKLQLPALTLHLAFIPPICSIQTLFLPMKSTVKWIQLDVKLRQSDQDCDKEIDHHAIDRGFEGRHEFKSLEDVVINCLDVMRKISLTMIHLPGINPYKSWNEWKVHWICSFGPTGGVLYQPQIENDN